MSDFPKHHEVSKETGSILAVYEHMMKGASQFSVTRRGNHLRFDAQYSTHPDQAKIKADLLKEWGFECKHDELGGWVYVDMDTTAEAIESVKVQNFPYLTLIDIGK